MLYNADQPKYYRFPSKTSLLDYEIDHHIYFPGQEPTFTAESHRHSHGESMTKTQVNCQKGEEL